MEPLADVIFVASINSGQSSVQVYDAITGTNLKTYRGAVASPSSVSLIGRSDYIMIGQKGKPLLQAWSLHRQDPIQLKLVVPGRVGPLAVNSVGPKYAVIGINEKLYIYKLNSGRLMGVISRHYQPVTCIKFTSCGNYFASASEDGFVYLWSIESIIDALHKVDASQIKPHFILGQHSAKVTDLVISSAGMRGIIVSTSLDQTAKVYDLISGTIRYTVIAPCKLTSVTMNSLGSHIFLGGASGQVWVLNMLPSPTKGNIQVKGNGSPCHDKSVICMSMTTSGMRLVTGGEDGEVKLWAVTHGSKDSSQPSLALQRTIHTGRGSISNIVTLRVQREIFNASEFNSNEVIAPLTPASHFGSPGDAKTLVYVNNDLDDGSHTYSQNPIQRVQSSAHKYAVENTKYEDIEDTQDLKSSIVLLKKTNSELYKFALENLIIHPT